MKWPLIRLCRGMLVIAMPWLIAWTIAERLMGETRSTFFMIRCDVLEGLHYFRQAWRRIPAVVVAGMRERRSRDCDNA